MTIPCYLAYGKQVGLSLWHYVWLHGSLAHVTAQGKGQGNKPGAQFVPLCLTSCVNMQLHKGAFLLQATDCLGNYPGPA